MNICLATAMITQAKEAAGKRERLALILPAQGESVRRTLLKLYFKDVYFVAERVLY